MGDGAFLYASSGGSDKLVAGNQGDRLFGDAVGLYNFSTGGADQITGGTGADEIYGDAINMFGPAMGYDPSTAGNDVINGGGGDDSIWGDAQYMDAGFAGHDNINGGAGNDSIWGDFQTFDTLPGGGTDTINGGSGDDELWGGPADDIFVFNKSGKSGPGNDVINDFNAWGDQDKIDLTAYHFTFAKLEPLITQNDADTTFIQLSALDTITVLHAGTGLLSSDDFIL